MESKWISDRSEFTMTMPVFSPARPSEVPSGMHDILLEELKERSWLEPNNLSSIYINQLIGWTALQIFTYVKVDSNLKQLAIDRVGRGGQGRSKSAPEWPEFGFGAVQRPPNWSMNPEMDPNGSPNCP